MLSSRRFLSAVLLGLTAFLASLTPAAPPTKDDIAKLVRQLGDDDFDTREAAERKLWDVGEIAEDALKEAAKSSDAEVSRRAAKILEKFKWGIYPDTPKNVVALIEKYQSADVNAKTNIIRELFETAAPGCKALLKIAKVEDNAEVRTNLMAQLSTELSRAVPRLVEANDLSVLRQLCELSMDAQYRMGLPNYLAFALLSGKIDERIAHHLALEKKNEDPKKQAEILAHLYRAKGDAKSALAAARRAEFDELIDNLLVEASDWKAVAERRASADPGDEIEKRGLRASYYRLAGQRKEMEEALVDLKKLTEGKAQDDYQHFQIAKGMFLNGRAIDAIEVLGKGDNQVTIFEVLCGRNQFKEAIDLVDKARFADSKEMPALEITLARTLHFLGEKQKAADIFARYAKEIKEGQDVSWYETLVEYEARVGLTDEAFEHAAKVLSISKDEGWRDRLFGKLYPSKKEVAVVWWLFLQEEMKGEEPLKRMKRLRTLLDGKLPQKEVAALLDTWKAKQPPPNKPIPGEAIFSALMEGDRYLLAGAEVALAAKLDNRAITILEESKTASGLQRLGDLHADKKRWAEAAKAYRKAWEADLSNPLPLWLAGWALKHDGKDADSKKLMEQAHWQPLGNEYARHEFAIELAKRRHMEASRRESDLILRTGDPGSYYTGEATRRQAILALMQRDYAVAVDGHEKSMLRVMRGSISFVQKQAYVGVPAAILKYRAGALAKEGKMKEALAEARHCLELVPGHIDAAIIVVPELEKRGMKKEADALFADVLAVNEKLCSDFPNSPWAHNSVAWLRGCLRRDLDQALEHALKATKLAPTNAGHHDTLAEVYFQRGDKAKAVEIQKKVVEMDPRRGYFRKQLARIEAGDPNAPRPVEEDDEEDDDD